MASLRFGTAPFSRAADRLAEKAVPIAAPSSAASAGTGKEQAYRAALRVVLRGRKLTHEEGVALAHLSDELGLTHKRAKQIWHDVESERPRRRSP